MQSEMKELDAILDYTIKHNKKHADELKDLSQNAKELGKTAVYDDLTSGVNRC